MITNKALVELMLKKLAVIPPKQEITVSDLILLVNPNAEEMTIDDLFFIDEQFRNQALDNGFILDSMKYDERRMLPFDTPFVVRRIEPETQN